MAQPKNIVKSHCVKTTTERKQGSLTASNYFLFYFFFNFPFSHSLAYRKESLLNILVTQLISLLTLLSSGIWFGFKI